MAVAQRAGRARRRAAAPTVPPRRRRAGRCGGRVRPSGCAGRPAATPASGRRWPPSVVARSCPRRRAVTRPSRGRRRRPRPRRPPGTTSTGRGDRAERAAASAARPASSSDEQRCRPGCGVGRATARCRGGEQGDDGDAAEQDRLVGGAELRDGPLLDRRRRGVDDRGADREDGRGRGVERTRRRGAPPRCRRAAASTPLSGTQGAAGQAVVGRGVRGMRVVRHARARSGWPTVEDVSDVHPVPPGPNFSAVHSRPAASSACVARRRWSA